MNSDIEHNIVKNKIVAIKNWDKKNTSKTTSYRDFFEFESTSNPLSTLVIIISSLIMLMPLLTLYISLKILPAFGVLTEQIIAFHTIYLAVSWAIPVICIFLLGIIPVIKDFWDYAYKNTIRKQKLRIHYNKDEITSQGYQQSVFDTQHYGAS